MKLDLQDCSHTETTKCKVIVVVVVAVGRFFNGICNAVDDDEFDDTKGVIRIRKSKDRQHNGQKKKDKQRSTQHDT